MRTPAARGRELNAATRLTAIFGDPVEHSGSPAMHNAAYAALGMDRAYAAFRVRPAELAAALDAIRALGILGVNLTVPHKESAARMLPRRSAEAKRLGAVNCVINRRGELFGDNTDARGLERDLRAHGVKLGGKLAVVIGAGGAAAAAVLTCIRMRARRIVIANRTASRAAALARRFAAMRGGGARLEARGLDSLRDSALLADAGLIVNATPMGLVTRGFAPVAYARTRPDCFFYDLLYAARPTPFLRPAIARGRRHADGAGMLVAQGELAFRLFNGVAAPKDVMRRALWERLGRNA
jgi:shikimate dehydrogenase